MVPPSTKSSLVRVNTPPPVEPLLPLEPSLVEPVDVSPEPLPVVLPPVEPTLSVAPDDPVVVRD